MSGKSRGMPSVTSTALTLTQLSAAVREVCDSHPVSRVELFGSRANGRANSESDVDLLIEFLPGASIGLLEMGGLKEELEQRLGYSVDLVSRAAVERSRNPYRRRSILAAPVTVYAR